MSRKFNGKSISYIIFDEPTQIKQKPKVSINPTRESLWVKEITKWLNEKHNKD